MENYNKVFRTHALFSIFFFFEITVQLSTEIIKLWRNLRADDRLESFWSLDTWKYFIKSDEVRNDVLVQSAAQVKFISEKLSNAKSFILSSFSQNLIHALRISR